MGWIIQGLGGSCREGVGHEGVGWVMQGVGWVMLGWGGVRMGWACRCGVGWVMQEWGGEGHAGVGSGGPYRGGMGWVMKNTEILKILNYWCYRVSNPVNQNQICRVLNFLNHDK